MMKLFLSVLCYVPTTRVVSLLQFIKDQGCPTTTKQATRTELNFFIFFLFLVLFLGGRVSGSTQEVKANKSSQLIEREAADGEQSSDGRY